MADYTAEMQAQTRKAQAELIDAGFRPARHTGPVRLLRRLVWPFVRPFHFHTLDRVAKADAAILRLEGDIRLLASQMIDPARLLALEARMDRAEAAADAASGDIERLRNVRQDSVSSSAARLEAVEAGIHALRDARRPAREQEIAHIDRIEKRLDFLEVLADGQRRQVERLATSRNDDMARMVALHTRLRSDLLAIGNRHVWVEERTAAAFDLVEQLRPLRDGLVLTATRENVFLLRPGESIPEAARLDGAWGSDLVRVAARALDVVRGRTMSSTLVGVDVGAHIGLNSVAMAKLFDTVISFEPDTLNVALLRLNILLNGLNDKVEVQSAAFIKHEGSPSPTLGARQPSPRTKNDPDRFRSGTAAEPDAEVHATALDALALDTLALDTLALDTLALEGVAFININAKGASGAVLLGAMDTIARCRPWVVFAWSEEPAQASAVSLDDIEARFSAIGYSVRPLHRHTAKQVDYLALPGDEAYAVDKAENG